VFIGDSPQDTTSTFIGSTEVVKDNSNPNFQTAIVIRYFPDKNEEIRFAVDDVDDGKNDLIGEAKVLVHALVEALEARKSIELELFRSGQSAGFLVRLLAYLAHNCAI
jgi:Ca2+-dependent lipid-binding protein